MNPDTHLFYEYMDKLPFTVRMKIRLDAPVDATLLDEAAQGAIIRFPYFGVRLGLDETQSYTLRHNGMPLPVLPERDERLVLGSDDLKCHLFAITWRDDCVWFNFPHAICGAYGALFWITSTLYLISAKSTDPLTRPRTYGFRMTGPPSRSWRIRTRRSFPATSRRRTTRATATSRWDGPSHTSSIPS
jgi:hypothetical protein